MCCLVLYASVLNAPLLASDAEPIRRLASSVPGPRYVPIAINDDLIPAARECDAPVIAAPVPPPVAASVASAVVAAPAALPAPSIGADSMFARFRGQRVRAYVTGGVFFACVLVAVLMATGTICVSNCVSGATPTPTPVVAPITDPPPTSGPTPTPPPTQPPTPLPTRPPTPAPTAPPCLCKDVAKCKKGCEDAYLVCVYICFEMARQKECDTDCQLANTKCLDIPQAALNCK